MIVVGETKIDTGDKFAPIVDYNLKYTSSKSPNHRLVEQFSVAELTGKYVNILWDDGSHKYNVKSFLGEIDEILKGERFSGFDQQMLDSVIGSLRERGNSNATINRKMAALSKLLRKAHKMGDIFNLPEFVRQKERVGRIRFLEYEEEKRLFAAIKSRCEDSYRLSLFLVDTGCRLGEAIGVTWNDVQDQRVTFWLTKSNRSRTVPLTRRARKAAHIPHEKLKGPFSMLNQVRFRQIWNEAKMEVGLGTDDQVVPHILRHTCASRLVRGGIDIRRVQMWLGHQTLQMTMRYAHLATHDLDSCVKSARGPLKRISKWVNRFRTRCDMVECLERRSDSIRSTGVFDGSGTARWACGCETPTVRTRA